MSAANGMYQSTAEDAKVPVDVFQSNVAPSAEGCLYVEGERFGNKKGRLTAKSGRAMSLYPGGSRSLAGVLCSVMRTSCSDGLSCSGGPSRSGGSLRLLGSLSLRDSVGVSRPRGVWHLTLALCVASLLLGGGCGMPRLSTSAELAVFDRAGPMIPSADYGLLVGSRKRRGAYHLVIGDVVEFTMPAILHASSAELPSWTGREQPYVCRVDQAGNVSVPVVGAIRAAGLPLAVVESSIAQAFYPKYVTTLPAVVGRVMEYRKSQVLVIGAVERPGVYELNSDEMSLVGALMKSGGIVKEGAAVIRVQHAEASVPTEPIVLPVKGLNIPFTDIALQEGDTVVVEGLNPQMFTVVGLVNNSGAFPYPPGTSYSLLQALAFAGGVDSVADPQFAKIYRQDASGRIVSAVFRISGTQVAGGASVFIKPGDVVSIEQTDYTRTRLLLSRIVKVVTGASMVYRINE